MTISSQNRTAGPYTGNGVTTNFPFPFKVFTEADMLVTRINLSGVSSILVRSSDYTVALNADQNATPGGAIVMLSALASGFSLYVTSTVSLLQLVALTNQGAYYPKAIEDALDRLTIVQQQVSVSAGGALRVPEIAGVLALPAAAARANLLLSFDGAGNPITAAAVAGTATALSLSLASFAGAGLIGHIASGIGAVARTAQSKIRDFVNVFDYFTAAQVSDVVAGTRLLDVSGAVQMAIDAVSAAGGGTVSIPPGRFRLESTLNLRSYVHLVGVFGENNVGGVVGTKTGTELSWFGASNGVILRIFSTRLSKFDGIFINGNSGAAVTGILLDSDNNPSGSQNEFHRFSIRDCYIGVQWGTSGLGAAYANDGTRFSTFTIWSNVAGSKGFVINSGNSGQMSCIENGGIQVQDIGIDIVVANILQIRQVFGGWALKTAFIRYSEGYEIGIYGCSSEGWGASGTTRASDSLFLKVVTPISPLGQQLWTTLTLIGNQINNPVVIGSPIRIIAAGNNWGQCLSAADHATFINSTGTFTISYTAWGASIAYAVNAIVLNGGIYYACLTAHTSGTFAADLTAAKWEALKFARALILNDGQNPNSIDITTGPMSGAPAQGWVDGPFVNLNLMNGNGWVAPSYAASNFTASGGMTISVSPSSVETYVYNVVGRQITIAFKINAFTLSGTQGYVVSIKIPGGKIPLRSMVSLIKISSGSAIIGQAYVSAGGATVDIQPIDSTLWTLGSNNVAVQGQITFECQ